MTHEELLKTAIEARENAYVPYSRFAVGAALLAKSGKVYRGCNVENAAYGLDQLRRAHGLFHRRLRRRARIRGAGDLRRPLRASPFPSFARPAASAVRSSASSARTIFPSF